MWPSCGPAPAGKHARLHVIAGRAPQQDWKLIVNVAGKDVLTTPIDRTTALDGWADLTTDLTAYAGNGVHIQVHAEQGSKYSPAYFAKLAVEVN